MTGSELIAAERARQQSEEGYDAAHDAGHAEELAQAAAAYALTGYYRERGFDASQEDPPGFAWPWDREYWKPVPHDRIRELVKAGALIAAAIDAIEDKP